MSGMFVKEAFHIDVDAREGRRSYCALDPAAAIDLLQRLGKREFPERYEEHLGHAAFEENVEGVYALCRALRSWGILHTTVGYPMHVYYTKKGA